MQGFRIFVFLVLLAGMALPLPWYVISPACADGGGGGGGGGDGGGDGDGDGGDGGDSGGDGGDGGSDGGGFEELDFLDYFNEAEMLPDVTLFSGAIRALNRDEELGLMARGWGQQSLAIPVRQAVPAVVALTTPAQPVRVVDTQPPTATALPEWRYERRYLDTDDDIAVIIANRNYTKHGSGIPDDSPALADAEAFVVFARESLGIKPGNILWLRDATQAQFLRVFGSAEQPQGQLHDWIKPGRSRVVVYYAGHGAPHHERDSFLVPVDADAGRLGLNGYALSTLYGNLGRLPARSVWVVLESCFSGVAQSGPVVTQASPVFVRSSGLTPPKGITVVSAAGLDQIASWAPDGSHSLFTRHFLAGMSGKADAAPFGNGDGRVDWPELDAYLKDTLTYWARRYYGRDQMAKIQAGEH